ncbi:hypothetical protein [Nonomuraea sp. C10]|uniref:hypothetical protein n=1 Tax=Nonomuraea sp. C10 TaxID=2600577 RepID=UPI0011CEB3AF|nr:hypothetical protein [Nonomuraea sp. C10]TXK33925.1 hypothetical protein FR742_31380 [Nonomuraea sp. C10]TXK38167.1 hypothetical protein FR742_00040 [Nonomuraea sp. C10]
MSFSGVKLPEFDMLVTRHTAAAAQMEKLASLLYGELTSAGLDTTPAERIRKLATQVGQEADDLRKRQRIVREIERHKITLGTSVATGSLIAVPDSLRQAQGQLDGTLAAKAAAAAGRGDRKAMAELQKYAGRVNDPEFVKTFLSKLGAKGITELPAALGLQVRANVNSTRDPQQVKQVQQVMKLLATTLAKGTNPKDEAFMGDAFLNQLVEEGRAEHKALEVTYVGYQAQALIWRASDGKPPFSERFMEVVGRDAIMHQKELSDSRTPYANSMDLATVLGISDSMQPGGPRMGQPGEPIKASVIDDLAQAAQYSLPAAQALLFHTPKGWNKSIMAYLLTDRLDGFNKTGNHAPFAGLLRTALSSKDKDSLKHTNEALIILKNELDGVFGRGGDGKLQITDTEKLKRLSFLAGPIGSVMAAHIDKVFTVFDERKPDLKGINHAEMDRLLAFVGSDAAATKSLVEAEVQRMLSMVHESYRRDGGEQIEDVLIPEARFMGHILETRRLYLLAQAKTDEQVKEEMKGMINSVLSELTGPAGKFATRFGFFGDKAHEKLTPMAFEKLSALLVDRMLRDGMTTGSAMQQASNDRTMTMSMIETMMLSARIAHGQWSDKALEGLKDAPFATDGSPPTLKPLHEIMADPATFDVFIKWARWHAKTESTTQTIREAMDHSAGWDVHDNFGIDRNY